MATEGSIERPSPTASPTLGSGLPSRAAVGVVSRFVKRYFPLLDGTKNAQLAQFYQEDSIVSRAEFDKEAQTVRGVDAAVALSSARAFLTKDSVTLLSVDIQESPDRSVIALTQGTLVGLDGVARRFVQTLGLAVVPGSEIEAVPRYYLRHDLLRILDNAAPAPVAAAAPVAVAVSAPVSAAPAPSAAVTTPAPQNGDATASADGDAAKAARPPKAPREPRAPKKDEKKEAAPKKDEKPAAPTTWAQRAAAAAGDKAKPDASPKTAPAAAPAPAPAAPAPDEGKEKAQRPARPPRDPKAPKEFAPKSNGGGNGASPSAARKERPPFAKAGAEVVAESVVVRNVPYETSEADLRALLARPLPEGYGIGSELTALSIHHGTAFLDFSAAEHAQRVLRAAQSVKVAVGGRELRVEARLAKPFRPQQQRDTQGTAQ